MGIFTFRALYLSDTLTSRRLPTFGHSPGVRSSNNEKLIMNRHMCYQPCLPTSILAPSVPYFIYAEKSDMRYRKVRDLYGLIDWILSSWSPYSLVDYPSITAHPISTNISLHEQPSSSIPSSILLQHSSITSSTTAVSYAV